MACLFLCTSSVLMVSTAGVTDPICLRVTCWYQRLLTMSPSFAFSLKVSAFESCLLYSRLSQSSLPLLTSELTPSQVHMGTSEIPVYYVPAMKNHQCYLMLFIQTPPSMTFRLSQPKPLPRGPALWLCAPSHWLCPFPPAVPRPTSQESMEPRECALFSRLHIQYPEIPHANSSEAASRALHTFSQAANVFVPRPRMAKGQ